MKITKKTSLIILVIATLCISLVIPSQSVYAKDKWVGFYNKIIPSIYAEDSINIVKTKKSGKYRLTYVVSRGNYSPTLTGKVNKKEVLVAKGMDGDSYVKIKVKKLSKNKVKVTEVYYTDNTYSEISSKFSETLKKE